MKFQVTVEGVVVLCVDEDAVLALIRKAKTGTAPSGDQAQPAPSLLPSEGAGGWPKLTCDDESHCTRRPTWEVYDGTNASGERMNHYRFCEDHIKGRGGFEHVVRTRDVEKEE